MKNTAFASIVIAGLLIMSGTATADTRLFNRFPDPRNFDRTLYDVIAERSFEGTVSAAEYIVGGVVHFRLKTADREMEVDLGPSHFVERSGFRLKIGEWVSVVGAPAKAGEREVVLARELWTLRAVFVVRDRNGEPVWDRLRPIQMDTDHPHSDSEMCEMIIP